MGRRKKGEDDSTIKKRLIESIGELYFTRGASMTTDDLSRGFRISKRTLFRIFPTKEQMILDVVRSLMQKITSFVDNALSKAPEARGPGSYIALVKPIAARMGSFVLSLQPEGWYGLEKSSPLLSEKIAAMRRETVMNAFGRVLKKGKEMGAIRPDMDTELASYLYAVMLEQIHSRGGFGPSRAPFDVYMTAVKIILSGVLQADGKLELDAPDMPRLKVDNLWSYLDPEDDIGCGPGGA
jgi:AcrR family transcriptional regulator